MSFQNKTKDYESYKYCIAICTSRMYKYFWSYKNITNNFGKVDLLESFEI